MAIKGSTVLIGLGVLGFGALAFATGAAAQVKAAPKTPFVPPLPLGTGTFDVVKGNAYQLLIQPTGPNPSMDVLASDLIGQGWAVFPGLRASVTTPGGMLTVPAIWGGASGKVSGQPSIRMNILNMSLSPDPGLVQLAMQQQPSAWAPGLLPTPPAVGPMPNTVLPPSATSGYYMRPQRPWSPFRRHY